MPDKIFKLKVTTTRLNEGHTMTLHTYYPNRCPYKVSTSYTLWFLRYSSDKLFPATCLHARQTPPTHSDTMGENNNRTAPRGCGLKMYVKAKYQTGKFNRMVTALICIL